MKGSIIFCVLFVVSCGGGSLSEPEPAVCNHETECSDYPTWQTWDTYRDGYSDYVCEPCWWNHHLEQRGDCCACDYETHHTWCDSDGAGIYRCSPAGLFVHESCTNYCVRALGPSAWYTNDDVCVDEAGTAVCDCGR